MWLVEVLQSMHNAVGSQVVDVELQGLHLLGWHVMEGDGVVADAVFALPRDRKQAHATTGTYVILRHTLRLGLGCVTTH